jgi:hypothetical protein
MIGDIGALCYLESRQVANRIRETLRQPARAVMYVVVIAYFAVVSVARGHGHHPFAVNHLPEPYASTLFYAYVTLLGVMMYGAASGIVGAFSSASDARFLSGSPLSERLVVLWLQLRRCGSSVARMLFTVLLYALMFSASGTITGIGFAVIGATILATGTAIPMLKLRRIAGARTAQSLAGVIAALGILPMVILLSSLEPRAFTLPWATYIERFGSGYALDALLGGNPLALGALYAAAALVVVLSYALGTGLYPELYASSMRVLAFREKQTRVNAGFALEHQYEQRATHATHRFFDLFRGPWTVLWKEWIAFMRSPSMQRVFIFGVIASAAIGAFFGYAFSGSHGSVAENAGFASSFAMMGMIFISMGSAIALSSDISKPLWWMGRDSLTIRLLAWCIATSWRLAVCLCTGIAAWAIVTREAFIAEAGIPLTLVAVLHLRVVGLALYSLFPSNIDQRGPLAFVRALLTFLLAAPPGIAALTLLLLEPAQPLLAIAAAVVCSLIETLLLIAFAARRIAGQGVAFARAEAL